MKRLFLLTLAALSSVLLSAAGPGAALQTIVFLGDSLTAGYGLRPEEAYPALIEKKISQLGRKARVVNAGVSGDTTADGLTRLSWVLRNEADILVVALGANDGLRGLPPSLTEENLRAIIDRARESNPRIKILLAGMLVPTNMGRDYGDAFARVFPTVAAEKRVALIPFLLEGVAAKPELNLPDGLHPNAAGQKIIAETVWAALQPLLKELSGAHAPPA